MELQPHVFSVRLIMRTSSATRSEPRSRPCAWGRSAGWSRPPDPRQQVCCRERTGSSTAMAAAAFGAGPLPAHVARRDGHAAAGTPATSSSSPATPTWTTPASAWRSSAALLEAQGFRVGIIAQPDWQSADAFARAGRPHLFFGVTAGNMDSMVNRYTSDRRIRSDDAYTPGRRGGQAAGPLGDRLCPARARGLQGRAHRHRRHRGSLRRIAHFDYWSEKVRRSILLDAKADLLVYGNAERQIVEIAHRLAAGEPITALTDLRGTAFVRGGTPRLHRDRFTAPRCAGSAESAC